MSDVTYRIKRPRAFGDDDDAEDWIPAKEKAAKRRREVMEAAMREAREKAMTNDQRIIRVGKYPLFIQLIFF